MFSREKRRMRTKHWMILAGMCVLISSCKTSKPISYKSKNRYEYSTPKDREDVSYSSDSFAVSTLIREAKKFLGTPYKYGGTNSSGLDCSGLVINAFQAVGKQMPRKSSEQAATGKEISLREVKEGDLVFFNTSGSSINHVGIVERVKNGEIFFIHSSTSKGVIISSIEETYWRNRFVKATRIL